MANMLRRCDGEGLANQPKPITLSSGGNAKPLEARYFRLTFPEPGKILLKVGPGDHSVQVFELTKDDLRGLVRDAIPQLL